jgi:hypothetical protein
MEREWAQDISATIEKTTLQRQQKRVPKIKKIKWILQSKRFR